MTLFSENLVTETVRIPTAKATTVWHL